MNVGSVDFGGQVRSLHGCKGCEEQRIVADVVACLERPQKIAEAAKHTPAGTLYVDAHGRSPRLAGAVVIRRPAPETADGDAGRAVAPAQAQLHPCCLWASELNRPIIICIHHPNQTLRLALSKIQLFFFSISPLLPIVLFSARHRLPPLCFCLPTPSPSTTQPPWPRRNACSQAADPADRASLSSSLCFSVCVFMFLRPLPSAANVLLQVNQPSARYSYFICTPTRHPC